MKQRRWLGPDRLHALRSATTIIAVLMIALPITVFGQDDELNPLPLRYPSPSECPAPVQSSGEVRHRLIDIGVPVGSQPYPISSRVVPPGNRIVLGGVTALIDSFAEQLVACENKDDWTLFGLQTDEYLKAHEPT
jgi:hypothetical protein